MPTELGLKCLKLTKTKEANITNPCLNLKKRIDWAKSTKLFSDISFDFRAEPVIKNIDSDKELRWNTWHISDKEVLKLSDDNYGLLIPINDDPNKN